MRKVFPLLLVVVACSKFQQGYREANNEEWEGKQAPPIAGGTWLDAGEVEQEEFRAAEYRILAFFKPT